MPRSIKPQIPQNLLSILDTRESCLLWIEKVEKYLTSLEQQLHEFQALLKYTLRPKLLEIEALDQRSEELLKEQNVICPECLDALNDRVDRVGHYHLYNQKKES